MKTLRDGIRAVLRALELDRLFSADKGFFVSRPPAKPEERNASSRSEIPPVAEIRIGTAFISPAVSRLPDESPRPGSPFATSFVASWRPVPTPPEEWIQFLCSAPFGTQATSARELRWNGREVSIERVTEAEIEAFVAKMDEWADYANREFAASKATPEAQARFDAGKRAQRLQEKLRR